MSEQLTIGVFTGLACHYKGCKYPVVGHSNGGDWYVCKSHNELEWGKALVKSKYWPEMGHALMAEAVKGLAHV